MGVLSGSIYPVHPRVCGEHTSADTYQMLSNGSSPRLRGTLAGAPNVRTHDRFIPASAGNTDRMPAAMIRIAVHPRVCGEHSFTKVTPAKLDGSSPRLRGTRSHCPSRLIFFRFIPASAGNTDIWLQAPKRAAVHPRVCGEHRYLASSAQAGSGSSPRLRGTLTWLMSLTLHMRFIPASAGNTHSGQHPGSNGPVHPRVCGEH